MAALQDSWRGLMVTSQGKDRCVPVHAHAMHYTTVAHTVGCFRLQSGTPHHTNMLTASAPNVLHTWCSPGVPGCAVYTLLVSHAPGCAVYTLLVLDVPCALVWSHTCAVDATAAPTLQDTSMGSAVNDEIKKGRRPSNGDPGQYTHKPCITSLPFFSKWRQNPE